MMRESKCSAGGCGRESIDHLDHGDYRVEGVAVDSVDSLKDPPAKVAPIRN